MSHCSDVLQEIIRVNKLSLSSVASICGLSKGMLSKYINKEAVPHLPATLAISSCFSVSIDAICGLGRPRINEVETLVLRVARIDLQPKLHVTLPALLMQADSINQKAFASNVGIAENTISQYMNEKALPDLLTLFRMADYLGVSGHMLATGVVFRDERFGSSQDMIAELLSEKETDKLLLKRYKPVKIQPPLDVSIWQDNQIDIHIGNDIRDAMLLTGRDEESFARQLAVTQAEVKGWIAGDSVPSHTQLALILRQTIAAALALRGLYSEGGCRLIRRNRIIYRNGNIIAIDFAK